MGCAKNEVDTRDMEQCLASAGFCIAESLDDADAIVVNTCSFILPAIEESIDAFFDISEASSIRSRNVPVIVAGCMPARFGDDLEDELTEAAAFVPCSEEHRIASVVADCLGIDLYALSEGIGKAEAAQAQSEPSGEGGPSFAYVKISDGCDRFCSYCTIPYIRGRYHSFALEDIEAEAKRAIDSGAREIVLIGQDTGLWGSDLEGSPTLTDLIEALSERFPDTWVRAMYTQPENVTDRLLDAIASHPNAAPYLDVPFQHCNPSILSAMNRSGSAQEFLSLVAKAREKVPGIAIRTTLMAGFPGETEDDFEELVRFVEEAELDYVGVFPYSREEGTAAFDLPGQLDDDERTYRAERLRTVADAVSSAVISSRVGKRYPVLAEGAEEDGQVFGRAIVQAPEVDGITYIDGMCPGQVSEMTVEDTMMYDMEASLS